MTKETILVVEDDEDIQQLLIYNLQAAGYEVVPAQDGYEALAAAKRRAPDLIILDLMLPGLDGFEACKELKRTPQTAAIPVIMLTARGDEVDRIVGLEMGADDYLPKPFNPRELVARIRAIQRRGESGLGQRKGAPGKITADDILIDVGTRSVYQHETEVVLTAVEFSLLYALVKRIGQVVNREDLALEVLGRKLEMFDRSIDVHISSLRKKLGHHIGEVERIKTIRGIGYMYSCLSEAA